MKTIQFFIRSKTYNFLNRHLVIEKLIDDIYCDKIVEENTNFKDELEFCYSLMKTIKNEHLKNNNKIILSKKDLDKWNFPIIFFDRLIIEINDNINGYILNKSKIDNKSKLFDKVYIKINCTGGKKLLQVLMHELCHAWDNYEAQLNGGSLVDMMVTGISNIDFSDDNIEKIYERIKYVFDEYKSKAFMKQFSVIHAGKKLLTFDQAKELFINDKYVMMFIKMISEWKKIVSNRELKQELLDYINNTKNTNITWKEFKSNIESKIDTLTNSLRNKMIESFNIWEEYDLLKEIEENKQQYVMTNEHYGPTQLFEHKIYNKGVVLIGDDIIMTTINSIFN